MMTLEEKCDIFMETFPGCFISTCYRRVEPTAFQRGDSTEYIMPLDESDEVFLDRIERSKQAGRNLFFEEWEKADPLPPIAKGVFI